MDSKSIGSFTYIAEEYLKAPIKALLVNFPGLGSNEMRNALNPTESKWAAQGMLCIYPFVNPWNWMNQKTVGFVDAVLDIVLEMYKLKDIPIIVKGDSMGGHSALTYVLFTRHTIGGAVATCPALDLVYHYSERPDLPRTLHDAFSNYDDIAEELKSRSPLHQVGKMPKIPYLVIHGINDRVVKKEVHSDEFVKRMNERGHRITYIEDPLMGHGNPISYETVVKTDQFMDSFI